MLIYSLARNLSNRPNRPTEVRSPLDKHQLRLQQLPRPLMQLGRHSTLARRPHRLKLPSHPRLFLLAPPPHLPRLPHPPSTLARPRHPSQPRASRPVSRSVSHPARPLLLAVRLAAVSAPRKPQNLPRALRRPVMASHLVHQPPRRMARLALARVPRPRLLLPASTLAHLLLRPYPPPPPIHSVEPLPSRLKPVHLSASAEPAMRLQRPLSDRPLSLLPLHLVVSAAAAGALHLAPILALVTLHLPLVRHRPQPRHPLSASANLRPQPRLQRLRPRSHSVHRLKLLRPPLAAALVHRRQRRATSALVVPRLALRHHQMEGSVLVWSLPTHLAVQVEGKSSLCEGVQRGSERGRAIGDVGYGVALSP
jgi:hypothetical protein